MRHYKFFSLLFIISYFISISNISYCQWQRVEEIKMINLTDKTEQSSSLLSITGTEDLNSISMIHLNKKILYCYTSKQHPDSVGFVLTPIKNTSEILINRQLAFSDSIAKNGVDMSIVKNKRTLEQLLMFNRYDTLKRSILTKNLSHWSGFDIMNKTYADQISSVFKFSNSHIGAYYCNYNIKTNEGGVILATYSNDIGVSWSIPDVAIKHNLQHFSRVSIAESFAGKKNAYIAVMSTPKGEAYISFNLKKDYYWIYPYKLPSYFNGKIHKIYIFGDDVYLFFEQSRDDNEAKRSLYLWKGSIKDIINKGRTRNNIIYKLADSNTNYTDTDDIQVSMISISGNKQYISIGNKWNIGTDLLYKVIRLNAEMF